MVYAEVTVFSPKEDSGETVRLLVATGSTLTWIDEETLTRLGVKPREIRTFRTMDGVPLERSVGDATIECLGLRAVTGVVFAKRKDRGILGVTALERLGLSVDPLSGTLRQEDEFLAAGAH